VAKVLDFGIAKTSSPKLEQGMEKTRTGALLGTPYYMSPEQAMGAKGIDFRTDLWSLGVVVFEAMTGTRPFDGETIGALAVAITHGPLPVPSSANGALPRTIDAWFARACARDVASRFGTAREMAEAFHAAISVAPQQVPQSGSTVRVNAPLVAGVVSASGLRTTTSPTSQSDDDTVAGAPRSSITKYIIGGAAVAALAVVGGVMFMRKEEKPHELLAATTAAPIATPSQTIEAPVVTVATPVLPTVTAADTTKPVGAVATQHVTRVSAVPSSAKPVTTTSAAAAKPDCNPPYTFEKDGSKKFKVECL
jgi:serine/threonine protein kinase